MGSVPETYIDLLVLARRLGKGGRTWRHHPLFCKADGPGCVQPF